MKVCCLCGAEFMGWGNNPEPVAPYEDGQCCDRCNDNVVVPARIRDLKRKANGIQEGINLWRNKRDEGQRNLDREQARLDDINLMIEHLEASMPHDPPPWRKGAARIGRLTMGLPMREVDDDE